MLIYIEDNAYGSVNYLYLEPGKGVQRSYWTLSCKEEKKIITSKGTLRTQWIY